MYLYPLIRTKCYVSLNLPKFLNISPSSFPLLTHFQKNFLTKNTSNRSHKIRDEILFLIYFYFQYHIALKILKLDEMRDAE